MAKKANSQFPSALGYKVISEYELGKCVAAIEAVTLLSKPIVEVIVRGANASDLEADLEKVIKETVRKPHHVKSWTLHAGENHYRYGFYVESWAFNLLKYLGQAKMHPQIRDAVQGLLFGYSAREIGQFLKKKVR